ncbi:hypothetical protein [Aestuariirhabdus litorea]|uniref:TIGR03546 family protein n=1 Tax=Aestuariirhabdus litorea TaxID=2528527 RepID=A0A3P3VQX9_9GAMM|nr:hypothetical protein [Aestuariirhabdus litorea]RRJ85030.1 hypothetical protein D0544_08120 [Aestuariirhabdus litorea]RWW98256.1 hypothetical protein DZC74_08115 [Endozoicomonadaceae bacterium GTF-13]
MITRKLGKVLRGNATPAQLAVGTFLAVVLGFLPGFFTSPGLTLSVLLLLLVFNANLTLIGILFAASKLLSLLLQPLSFALGRQLLEGGTEPFFAFLVNAPVWALFGFEYYLTTGALALGMAIGLVGAIAMVILVGRFRRTMAGLEQNSERFALIASNPVGRVFTWVFLGAASDQRYQELVSAKGKLIRWPGILVALLVCGLLWALQEAIASSWVIEQIRRGAEQANGATVELAGGELDLAEGRLVLEGIAIADPEQLDRNLFSAQRLEADLSSADLLRKRLRLERVSITGGAYGLDRDEPGVRLASAEEPQEESQTPSQSAPGTLQVSGGDLDRYLSTASLWRQRFQQFARWLQRLPTPPAADQSPVGETLEQRLRRQIEGFGYALIRADHLVQQSPLLSIGELQAEQVSVPDWPEATLNIRAWEFSSQPWLSAAVPALETESSDQRLMFKMALGALGKQGGENRIHLRLQRWPAQPLLDQLALQGDTQVLGGVLGLEAEGTLGLRGEPTIELPILVSLANATLSVRDRGEAPIKKLEVKVGISGPVASPDVKVDEQGIKSSLQQLAGNLVKQRAREEVDKQTEKARQKAQQEAESRLGGEVGGALKGILK